ncbi:hypothetical protein DPEC_G00194360 [Dallia pectoralis]|uniref:Uncharacterized protein n=1 Tax=Dallia pectoralis TaxID=75939 RepID=A0ACC2G739_DALPE|nr:hypothetical protein DPEC_G00194360 [Dallia pectoralis]
MAFEVRAAYSEDLKCTENNSKMHFLVRRYRPSDQEAVLTLFRAGTLEHISPLFFRAMSDPFHVVITLCLSLAGYLLRGVSILWALLLPSAWAGLIYYCCRDMYTAYVREKLGTDMQDIPGHYLSSPNNCFWVAEAQVNGRVEIWGMGAVVAKKVEGGGDGEMCGHLYRMIVSSRCRRMRLGSRITQTVIDFCKERGFSKVVLETSSIQTSALALYKKMGFKSILSHTKSGTAHWMMVLSRVTILKMEKGI